jgi:D-xylonolactonase
MEPELIADYECHTGEGPLWHPDEELLYWVDIPNGRLFRYDPTTDDHEQCYDTDVLGGFTVQADGSLLLFEDRGRVEVWRDGDTETLIEEIPGEEDSRFNDVVADPEGRVFCGTMPTDERGGRLYRLDADATYTVVEEDVAIPNGMGFTPDRESMYFTETEADAIYRYEYDAETGALSNRETFVDTSGEAGGPDGMTVDAEGYVWSARWDGGCLVRYDPGGEEVDRVEFPARKVSSVVFGGDDYADAYVTTALGPGEDVAGTKDVEGEGAGALFRITPDVGGVAEFRSRVGL